MSSELLTRHIRERQTMHSQIYAKPKTVSVVLSEGVEEHEDQNRLGADDCDQMAHTTEACLGQITHRAGASAFEVSV